MPLGVDLPDEKLYLIHYNMLWKPWVFENINYAEVFWTYAKQCPMYDKIVEITKLNFFSNSG